MQAVMASDFAIAQFRFLCRLMLVHGHWSYDRIARMILYFYYKNTINVFVLFWFQFYCGFTAMTAIDQIYLMMYNLLFTSLPVMVTAVFDQDVSERLLTLNPILYEISQKDLSYKNHFTFYVLDGVYQSLVIHFVNYWAFMYSDFNDLTVFGTATYTSLILAASIQIGIETRHWVWINFALLAFSVILYFAFALVYNAICCNSPTLVPSSYMVMEQCMANAIYWWAAVILAPLAAVGPGLMFRLYRSYFHPTSCEYAREHSVLRERLRAKSHSRGHWWTKMLDVLCPVTSAHHQRSSLHHRNPSALVPVPGPGPSLSARIISDEISLSQMPAMSEDTNSNLDTA